MGMDLSGVGGYFRWSAGSWSQILDLGLQHGWEPTGTGPPRGTYKADHQGIYHGNDGQLFYARDAKKLADALEQALAEMSFKKPVKKKRIDQRDWLSSPEGIESIRQFIKFCRKGSFRID
jgi:hypothetical protein